MIPHIPPQSINESVKHRSLVQKSVVLALIILLSSCNSTQDTSIKLYAFDCGRLNYDSIEPLGIGDDETTVRDLIAPCYIVEHPKGRLLWEGGLPPDLAKEEGWQEMEGGWRMRLDKTFKDQIAELGLSTSDFDYIAFSHFHFDHIGTANDIEGATLLIQRPEHAAAFADSVIVPGFTPDLYSNLKESEKVILDGIHDVFGDGRVRLIPTPGHTTGHQSLYLDLSKTGPVVLSGDLHIFRVGRADMRVPPFNVDSMQTVASMKQVEALLETTGAELWIGHDLSRFNQLKKPPNYQD